MAGYPSLARRDPLDPLSPATSTLTRTLCSTKVISKESSRKRSCSRSWSTTHPRILTDSPPSKRRRPSGNGCTGSSSGSWCGRTSAILDPFAGGGTIPLEAQRLNADRDPAQVPGPTSRLSRTRRHADSWSEGCTGTRRRRPVRLGGGCDVDAGAGPELVPHRCIVPVFIGRSGTGNQRF